jgi:hypothetical protein
MLKDASAKKTPEQIRATTIKLINAHEANFQGWLSAHHPNAAIAINRQSFSEPNSAAQSSSQTVKRI